MLAPPAGHYIPSGHLDHVKEVLGAAPPGNSVDRKVRSARHSMESDLHSFD
jgi:hypothetical protein